MDDWLAMSGKQRRSFTLQLIALHGAVCCICQLPIKAGEESCQHVIPRSKGGPTNMDNCRPAHRSCNYGLGNREVDMSQVHDGLAFFWPPK